MTTRLLVTAAALAALSVSAVQAQETTTNTGSTSTAQSNQATPSADSSSYGGTPAGQSATGKSSKWSRGLQPSCSPRPFCDIYSGGQ